MPDQLDILFDSAAQGQPAKFDHVAQKSLDHIPLDQYSSEGKCPEKLLILDTETTGLDPDVDNVIEVGAILFHVSSRAVLTQQSFLLPTETNSAETINKIPAEVTRLSKSWEKGIEYLMVLLDEADVLVAHNASFDRQWFGKEQLPPVSKPWICSMDDFTWPESRNLRPRPSVRDLALAYGVPVWSAHRALTDCIYLAEVFSRCIDLEILILHALEPRTLMIAKVSYEERHLAKKAGFRWNDPVLGAWSKRMTFREASSLDFPVKSFEKP